MFLRDFEKCQEMVEWQQQLPVSKVIFWHNRKILLASNEKTKRIYVIYKFWISMEEESK